VRLPGLADGQPGVADERRRPVVPVARKEGWVTSRPTQPTGFRFAAARLRRNLLCFTISPEARADLTHSWADVHVEGVRSLGVPHPKVVGKGIVALEIGLLVALIVWPVLVAL